MKLLIPGEHLKVARQINTSANMTCRIDGFPAMGNVPISLILNVHSLAKKKLLIVWSKLFTKYGYHELRK